MRLLKFYKEPVSNEWFVDLPEWTGSKEDLEMIFGADNMLDMLAEGESEVILTVSEYHFIGAERILLNRLATDIGSGAYYRIETYKGVVLNHEFWLCDIMLFVFNRFPQTLFFIKSN